MHHGGADAHPETLDCVSRRQDEQAVRERLARYLPPANGQLREAAVCIDTNTPKGHFIIDVLDPFRRVVVASPCSGHGYEFGSAAGEGVACLATHQRLSRHPP